MMEINVNPINFEISNIQMLDDNLLMNHNNDEQNHCVFTYDWKLLISKNLHNKTIKLPFIEETSLIITVFGENEESQDFIIQLFNNLLSKPNNNEINQSKWPSLQTECNNNYSSSDNVELNALFVNANKNKIQNDFIFFKLPLQPTLYEHNKEGLITYYNQNAFLSSILKELILNSDLIIFANVLPFSVSEEELSTKVIQINTNANKPGLLKEPTNGYLIYNLQTQMSFIEHNQIINEMINNFHQLKEKKNDKNKFTCLSFNQFSSKEHIYEWLINYLPLNQMNLAYNITLNVNNYIVELVCELPGCNMEDTKSFIVKECYIVCEATMLYFEVNIMGNYLIEKVNLSSYFGKNCSFTLSNARFDKYKNGLIYFVFELNKV